MSFKKVVLVLIGSMSLWSCQPESSQVSANKSDPEFESNLIYGVDDRLDIYEVHDSRLRALADSTVALMRSSDLQVSDSDYRIIGENYGSAYRLCSSEKFVEQDTAAFCSGFLVSEDLVVTAGHCVRDAIDCASIRFVFGFALANAGILPQSRPVSEVYNCQSIVQRELTSNGPDYALVKLDRPVTGHRPLAIRRSGSPAVGDSLLVIGHPAGLPTKVAAGAAVRSVASADYIVANLDTYGGNSGSAVFNTSTQQVEGILVRGDMDFVPQGSCYVSNVCPNDSCRGEDVTRITKLAQWIPQAPSSPNPPAPPTPPAPPSPPSPPSPPEPPAPTSQVFRSTAVPLSIPDNNSTGVKSAIDVQVLPQGRKVQVQVEIEHTYIGDLLVKLVAPTGKTITLHNRTGRSQQNIIGTYGVDLTSAQSLASLSSVLQKGKWTLQISDRAGVDIGTLKNWSLIFAK